MSDEIDIEAIKVSIERLRAHRKYMTLEGKKPKGRSSVARPKAEQVDLVDLLSGILPAKGGDSK